MRCDEIGVRENDQSGAESGGGETLTSEMGSVCFAATNCLDCQRDLLRSQWDVQLTLTWLHMLPRATVPGYRRSVGRVALHLEAGRATCRSRTAQDSSLSAVEMGLNARGSCERAGPIGWGEPVTLAKK